MLTKSVQFVQGWLRAAMHNTNSLLAPVQDKCVYCANRPWKDAGVFRLCKGCYEQVPWIRNVECAVCGRAERCYDCRRRTETYFVANRSAVRYDQVMKSVLAKYKYRGDERLNSLFTEMLAVAYQRFQGEPEQGGKPFDCLTYIPLSHERLIERGFNQAEQFARGIGRKFNVPVLPLLCRMRHTDKQSYKTRGQRLEDLHNVFAADEDGMKEINKLIGVRKKSFLTHLTPYLQPNAFKIVIIDDVFTTGSTLNQCAKILTTELDAKVYGLTWAR